MTEHDINALAVAWSCAKMEERQAVEHRRSIEDKLTAALAISETEEGVRTRTTQNYTIKVTSRLNRKVDADLIQEIASEHGYQFLLPMVCRWKPELDMVAWKALDDEHRAVLGQAITTTASRPSYAITYIETKE